MRFTRIIVVALPLAASIAGAQQPDSSRIPRTKADSIAKAVRDSIALMKELGAAVADSAALPAAPVGTQGPTNPRLLPDVSAVGDLVGDLSPKGSTQEDKTRLGVREVEITVAAVVDPYFKGDVLLGISDLEGVAIEQAQIVTTALPYQLELHVGRFFHPFGKQNTTHRHDLHTIEYPYVIQRFLGAEGLRGTGLWASRVFAPFGFYQELLVTALDRFGSATEGLTTFEPVNKSLTGMGYSARLRNYVDLSESQNVELSFSGITGRREQPLDSLYASTLAGGVNALSARQSIFGVDLTYRWRPLQQGLYQSFILQGEVMRQVNERNPLLPGGARVCGAAGGPCADYVGPASDYTGAYLFARYQTSQRSYLGARYDYLQDPQSDGRTLRAGSVYLEVFPSEFSKLVAGYEAVSSPGSDLTHRLLVQAVFSLGPHKAHPF